MTLRKKLWITIACLSVILCTLVTGSIAWLTDKTTEITNTFTPSNIDVELSETKDDLKMVPGTKLAKAPQVTVRTDIECYVFLVVNESSNLNTYIAYALDSNWKLVDGETNVYYQVASATTTYGVLVAGAKWGANEVYVKDELTKDQMDALYNTDGTVKTGNLPTLTFTAYACQKEGFANAAAAWDVAKTTPNPTNP